MFRYLYWVRRLPPRRRVWFTGGYSYMYCCHFEWLLLFTCGFGLEVLSNVVTNVVQREWVPSGCYHSVPSGCYHSVSMRSILLWCLLGECGPIRLQWLHLSPN